MTKETTMLRRAAVLTAGLAMTVSIGLAGAGAASAASPAGITNGSKWTLEVNSTGVCEVDTFSTTTHTFTSDLRGDSGHWSVPAPNKVKMKWTAGTDVGLIFPGVFTSTPVKEYVGSFRGSGVGFSGQLVKGVVPTWNGVPC
jgi:hypothetical protein